VRWKVAGTLPFSETFRTKALADNFRAQLLRAVQKGEEFDTETGLPDSMASVKPSLTWYDFARAYIAMKWPHAAPNSRDSANETMTLVTTQLLDDRPGRPADDVLRRALRGWAFVAQGANNEPPPVDIANALGWVAKASLPLVTLKNPADIRRTSGASSTRSSSRCPGPRLPPRRYGARGPSSSTPSLMRWSWRSFPRTRSRS
jgi:antitoxin (DNA-binding transcriptional repressor) of toxin-antitoxin stability system